MMLNKVYIIEKLPDIVPSFEGLVISLIPEVSHQLSKMGVAYSIPEDYLPMQELYSEMPAYIKLFDGWLNGLDETLWQHFKKLKVLNVKPARLYGDYLGWIIGSFVTNALFIKAILEKTKPSKVIYFHPEERSKPIGIEIWNEKETISSILIPLICKNKDIELQEVIVGNVINKKESKFNIKITHLLYYLYKYYKLIKIFPSNILNIIFRQNAILSLHYFGWGIDEILHSAGRVGYQVLYVKSESFNEAVGYDVNLINETDLNMKLFNTFVGFDLSDVLKDKVKYFIEEIVPKLEVAIPKYQELFIKKRIAMVIGYSKDTFVQRSIIAAAVASTSTLAVLFTHGYDVFASPFMNSLSEGPCDLYLTFNEELKEFFSVSVFKKNDVIVEKAPLWVKKITNIRGSRKAVKPHGRPFVLYIPALLNGDFLRLDTSCYSSCWYFEHQMKLLEYFAREQDFYFVWKGLPQSEKTKNPIPDVIKENGYDNIEFSFKRLNSCFIKADYAIMDYPSSALYEVAASGIPTLALCHESFRIRKSAKALFGDILEQFFTTEEAIWSIGKFLRSNPDHFLVNIDLPEDIDFKVIERHRKNKLHVR